MTKRVSNLLPVTNNIVICITHLIANQGGMGRSQWNEASGQKVQYQADVKLKALYQEVYKDKADGEQVGQIIHWQCETNALKCAPMKKAQSLLRYGYGIDCEYEILKMCIEVGLVEQSGAWIKFPNDEKLQGIEKARNYLAENPKTYQELQTQFNEMMGL